MPDDISPNNITELAASYEAGMADYKSGLVSTLRAATQSQTTSDVAAWYVMGWASAAMVGCSQTVATKFSAEQIVQIVGE